jgi:hypothetical protein
VVRVKIFNEEVRGENHSQPVCRSAVISAGVEAKDSNCMTDKLDPKELLTLLLPEF